MRSLVLACLLMIVSAAPSAAFEPLDARATVKNAVEGFIRPGYHAFVASTRSLEHGVDALCASPSVAALEWARARFSESVRTWAEIEIIRFGPVTEKNRLERILFWPDRKGVALRQVETALAATSIEARSDLSEKSVAVQGYGALEFLLFGTGSDMLAADGAAPRCGFAQAVAGNLDGMATEIAADWDDPDGISRDLMEPGPGNRYYRNDEEALTELLDVLVHGLEQVRDVRIGGFLGDEPVGDRPKQAVFWRSAETVATIAANLRGMRSLYFVSGMGGLLDDDERWMSDQIRQEFDNAADALAQSGGPVAESLMDDRRGRIAYARVVVGSLLETFSERVSGALGLTSGFSSLDGD